MLLEDALNGFTNNKKNGTNFTWKYNLLCDELTVI